MKKGKNEGIEEEKERGEGGKDGKVEERKGERGRKE